MLQHLKHFRILLPNFLKCCFLCYFIQKSYYPLLYLPSSLQIYCKFVLQTEWHLQGVKFCKCWYKSGMQTSPLTFMTIFEACGQILAPQHMFPLILLGLRILKWGETFL